MRVQVMRVENVGNGHWEVELAAYRWMGMFGSTKHTYTTRNGIIWYELPDFKRVTPRSRFSNFLERTIKEYWMKQGA